MSGNDDARLLLDAVTDYAETAPGEGAPSYDRPVRLATIAPGYSGSGAASVTFDGEAVATTRTYLPLAPVAAGQRVALLPAGHTYIILGGINAGDSAPVGTIIEGLWASAPTGYLLLDGQVVLRADYPNLFALIGTTYNTGGETGAQFRLPNMKGRVTVHRDSGDASFNVLGEVGGAKTHTLTIAEMPAHNHTQSGHTHALNGLTRTSGSGSNQSGTGVPPHNGAPSADQGIKTTTTDSQAPTIQNTGGGGAHNNMQPYMVVNRAVRF